MKNVYRMEGLLILGLWPVWGLASYTSGTSLALLDKGREAESQRGLEEEGRLAWTYALESCCRITNDNHHDDTGDGGDNSVTWLGAGALIHILAWIFILRQVI